MMSLAQIEVLIEQNEVAIIDLHEGIQEDAEIVDLILAGDDSARSKTRRLRVLRRVRQRSKDAIAMYERALANLEAERRRRLSGEHPV